MLHLHCEIVNPHKEGVAVALSQKLPLFSLKLQAVQTSSIINPQSETCLKMAFLQNITADKKISTSKC